MKHKLKPTTILLVIFCFLGLSSLLYPTISDYWNSHLMTSTINSYVAELEDMEDEAYNAIWQEAVAYNQSLLKRSGTSTVTPEMKEAYNKCLNVNGNGVMGYIEIGKMGLSLPVYHGTDENVLQSAIGHIEWSSLPTGGEGTHCAVSGHRGLPSAKLFTDLDSLREGDTFTFHILNEVLTYEVDQIRTVLPTDVTNLSIEPGKDYCTLVTCTPYGVNTHRLLVRGHRVESMGKAVHIISEAVIIDPLIVAVALAIPILFVLFMMVMLKRPEKKQPQEEKKGEKTAKAGGHFK